MDKNPPVLPSLLGKMSTGAVKNGLIFEAVKERMTIQLAVQMGTTRRMRTNKPVLNTFHFSISCSRNARARSHFTCRYIKLCTLKHSQSMRLVSAMYCFVTSQAFNHIGQIG